MCKYCDKIETTTLCHYDNGVGCGSKCGIGVSAWIQMKGNTLRVSGAGRRWTEADDYYESWGLEVDGEAAPRSQDEIVKINYCPFCGKKITDDTFEKETAKKEIPLIEKKLKSLNELKDFYCCVYRIQEYGEFIKGTRDRATIFVPYLIDCEIGGYHSSSKSLTAYDYDGVLPFDLSEWGLRYTLPYKKSLFNGLDKQEFVKCFSSYQRGTALLVVDNLKDVEELFDTIGENNKKWKWNKERTLKEINNFHNKVLRKITELENRKAEIESWIKP